MQSEDSEDTRLSGRVAADRMQKGSGFRGKKRCYMFQRGDFTWLREVAS